MPAKRKSSKPSSSIPVMIRMPEEIRKGVRDQAMAETRTQTTIIIRALSAERAKLEQAKA
jgi:hypothetical protein